MAWPPDGEKISKISLFVLAHLTNVTDGRTDGLSAIAELFVFENRPTFRVQKLNAINIYKSFTIIELSGRLLAGEVENDGLCSAVSTTPRSKLMRRECKKHNVTCR